MNTDTIKRIFQSQFNYRTYCNEIVHNIFGCNDIATSPEQLPSSSDGDQNYFIGRMADADSRELGFFYTRVAEGSDVRRKRVGLRKLIAPYLKYEVDAAIAVFDDGNHWRLSYICDMKEGATAAKRFSYILGDPQGQYKTPLERLVQLGKQASRLQLKNIFEAFSVETLSDEFFDLYRDHYADIVEYLTGKRMVKVDNKWVEKVIHASLQSVYDQLTGVENADKIVRDYVKKMMGRIVFLHFLQKKGWLNRDVNFMRHTFGGNDSCQDDFLEKILEPLFFGFLNTREEDRAKLFDKHPNWDKNLLAVWKNIPYLNGGLFEQDEVDKLNIRLPRSMFDDLFKFLAEYNFTVDENDPDDAEVGVDPEMLGKIFESLLEDNKAKGAFYTPKEIVRYMCKESLIAYLDSKLESAGTTEAASERLNARSANNPTQGTQCGNGENITATTNASERLNAQSANNPTQGTQCGDNDSDEKCVSETRDLTSNGENSGGLPDASERLNARSANNPTQGTQCGGSECESETRDLKTAIRAFVEHHEMQPELESYRDTLDAVLRNVKICDPAIGSGAFPMGLLNELWRCREALMDAADTSERCVLSNTVQAKRSAVTSTEKPLRAGGTRPQTRVELKKQIIENNIYGVDIERGAIDIARLRFWLSIVVDAEEPEPLPNFDYKFMQGNSLIESYKGIDLSRISNRLRGGQSKSTQLLLGLDSDFSKKNLQLLIRDYFKTADHKQKSSMRQAINDEVKRLITDFIGGTAADLDKLDPSANQDFFLWHTWFKDIFDNGGFDIVIGNPPYVVVEANGKYSNYETESCYDLYAYFFERAVKLLNSSGVLSFITSSLYVKGLKYTTLRSFLQNNTSLIAFRIEGDDVFKNAGIPTATLIANKAKGQWKFEDLYMDQSLTEKIRKGTVALSFVSSIMRGFEIGRNMVDSVGQYKFLTGSDVSKYCYNKLSYISQSVLNAFSKDVRFFSKERILLRETGSFLTAVYLGNETIYSNRSLYSILITDKTLSTKYVLALLNSSLLQWYYSNMFKGDTELFPKIRIAQAKQLPIIKVTAEQQQPIVELIDKILALKQSSPNADITSLENEIDKLVYQLYNLTPEEIAIIEQSAK